MEKNLIPKVKRSLLLILLTGLIIFFPRISQCQGLDNIGFAAFNLTSDRFNCANFISANAKTKTLHIAFLYNTFGNNFSCLQTLLGDARLKTLQIHLINEPGHRNRRLGSYEFLFSVRTPAEYNSLIANQNADLKRRFGAYVAPLKSFLDANLKSHTELIISPGLESNLSDSSGRILISWTREIFQNARIVWNPLRKNSTSLASSTGDFLEGHGLFPTLTEPCIFNLDGADVSYPDRPALGEQGHTESQTKNWIQSGPPVFQLYEEMANTCEVAFFWAAESNGLDYRRGFVDPRARQNSISLTSYRRLYADVNRISSRGLIYPKPYSYTNEDDYATRFCSEVRTNFKDGFKVGKLLKQSEFRNRGGVLILTREFDSVSTAILYKGSTVVDTYRKTGKYKDGRNLFRSSRSPTTYPFGTYLVLNKKSSKICYKLPNPRIRLD
jgi:hypothetical protein